MASTDAGLFFGGAARARDTRLNRELEQRKVNILEQQQQFEQQQDLLARSQESLANLTTQATGIVETTSTPRADPRFMAGLMPLRDAFRATAESMEKEFPGMVNAERQLAMFDAAVQGTQTVTEAAEAEGVGKVTEAATISGAVDLLDPGVAQAQGLTVEQFEEPFETPAGVFQFSDSGKLERVAAPAPATEQFSEPFVQNGQIFQRNLATNEISRLGEVPEGTETFTAPFTNESGTFQFNEQTNRMVKIADPPTPPSAASRQGKLIEDRERFVRQFGEDSQQVQAFDELVAAENAPGPPDLSDVRGMRQEFTALSGDFMTMRDALGKIETAFNNPTPAGDLNLIFGFMRMLDPKSVVRESEFAQAAATGSFGQRVQAAFERVTRGQRLTDEQRADFTETARGLFASQTGFQGALETNFRALATSAGFKPEDVVIDFQASGAGLPEGVPEGSQQIGTSGGNPVFETPDGRRIVVEP